MKSVAGTLAAPFVPVVFLPVMFRGLPVPGYVVTSDGRIWSNKAERYLKPYPVGGYLAFALCRDGKIIRAYLHQLVAEAFIGPRPAGLDVCHNDGNRLHNHTGNLRYATRAENLADREAHGTTQRGERNPSAKLTDAQAAEVRTRRAAGETLRVLAGEFGVRESAISRIANGKRRALT